MDNINIKLNMEDNLKKSFMLWLECSIIPKIGFIMDKEVSLGKVYPLQSYPICTEKISIVNADGTIQTSVSVKSNGSDVSPSLYVINHVTNEISFKSTLPLVVIYLKVLTVDVRESFPEGENFDNIEYPIISADITDSFIQSGYAIGSSQNFWSMSYYVDIFANNDNVRKRLKNGLQYLIKLECIPLIDFTQNDVYNNDGSINSSFSMQNQFIYDIYDKGNPNGKIFDDNFVSEKMRYRATVDGIITIIY